ncbi:MAG: M56 family metallopeptidase [Candidatus Acidiferrales bacterium]
MMPITTGQAATSFWKYLAEPAARSLALGCLAAIALAAFRVKRVPLRLLVWTMTLYAALAMPFLGVFLPRMTVPVPARTAAFVQSVGHRVAQSFRRGNMTTMASARVGANVEPETSRQLRQTAPQRDVSYMISGVPANGSASGTRSDATTTANAKAGANVEREASRQSRQSASGTDVSYKESGVAAGARGDMKTVRADAKPIHLAPASRGQESATLAMIPKSFTRPVRDSSTQTARGTVLPATQRSQTQKGVTISWVAVGLGIYLTVTVLFFARLFVGMFFSWRLERASEEIHEREAIRLVRMRACMGGLENTPRLAETKMLSVPATLGVLHPVILLPMDWREWDEAKLDAIVAHEVSHVARRDALTQRLSLIHRAIFWFSPLAWWIDRQITELAEEASDEAALAGGADQTRYAETLLGFFAELEAAPGRIHWEGISMANGCRAERRVERILSWKGSHSMKKWLAVMIVAVAAPLVFVAGSAHPLLAQEDNAPKKAANKLKPGGPVAPALPNAPSGGVVAPAIGPAPQSGIVAPPNMTPPAPASAPTVAGPAAYEIRPTPALMPVPGAPEHPLIVPGPIASGFVAPSAMTAPMTAPTPYAALAPVPGAPENPPTMPTIASDFVTPEASLIPTGPVRFGSVAPEAPAAPVSLMSSMTPVAPQATITVGDSVSGQEAEAQLRAALKDLQGADAQSGFASAQVHAAQDALMKAQQASEEVDSAQMRGAQEALKKARRIIDENDASQMRKANEALAEAKSDLEKAEQEQGRSYSYGYRYSNDGPRYVMMTGDSNNVTMSGSDEDVEHAQRLRKKMGGGDLIWFERDEKSYVITDPAFIAKVKALFAPEEDLGKQQEELGRQQEALGKQQEALGNQMEDVKVKIHDITPQLEEVRARMKELQATGATQRELGQLQGELGRLQGEVGRFQAQAGVGQREIGQQQGELGRKQGELGRRQGELGRKQGELARQASHELRGMFDDAIAKRIAKPE